MIFRVFFLLAIVIAHSLISPKQTSPSTAVDPFNIPADLKPCLKAQTELQIDVTMNPFYISGDFDGDGFTDFAVQVIERKNHLKGVLFCFANGKMLRWGAGISTGASANISWDYHAWEIARKGGLHLSAFPKVKFDSIILAEPDVGGGLIYWDGRDLRWQVME
jgi:hypothetical protein